MTSTASAPAQQTAYDDMPYESFTYSQTHPQQMFTVGKLFGLTPPDFRHANILELGCASGGNILPLAIAYPKANIVGIDLSREQIALAEKQREELGLKNITFLQEDISKFDLKKNAGKFDYIICHGILSWVPENVRDAIFELCDKCLSADGMAVISYNTLPGWNAVRSLREMMLFHTKRFNTPREKVSQARALLDFLLESVPDSRVGYKSLIEEERKLLSGSNDSYLFHDHMESVNAQFYLNEFVSMANKHGLAYVGDTAITTMYVGNLPKSAQDKLKGLNDIVLQEQYIDFILNRRFRTSILCKQQSKLTRALRAEQIMDFYLSTQMRPDKDAANANPEQMVFKVPGGGQFATHGKPTGMMFSELAASSPKPVAASELIDRVIKQLPGTDRAGLEQVLQRHGLELALRGMIQLHSESPNYVTTLSDKPVAHPFARLQAKNNARSLTNCLYGMTGTDILGNMIVALLDGQHTHAQIKDHVTAKVLDGTLNVSRDGQKVTDEKIVREEVDRNVTAILKRISNQGLLIG